MKNTALAQTGGPMPPEIAQMYEAELAQCINTGFMPTPIQVTVEHRRRTFLFPDGEEVRELKGVVLKSQIVRGYWEPGEKRPVCFSEDGVVGRDAAGQEHLCARCAKNQFGSRENGGKGKACKEMRRVLFLPEGYALPILLTVPPTSLRNFDRYASALATRKVPLSAAVTTITLEKAETDSNEFEFARLVLEKNGLLPPEEFKRVLQMRDEMLTDVNLGQIPEEELENPQDKEEDIAEISF